MRQNEIGIGKEYMQSTYRERYEGVVSMSMKVNTCNDYFKTNLP